MSRCLVQRIGRWQFWAMLGLIVLIGVAARAILVRPPIGDDIRWLSTSARFGNRVRADLESIYYSRPLFRLVLYIWISIAGDEVSKTPILTNGLAIATITLIAICGWLAAGQAGALVAAALYVFHPIALATDTYCLADGLGTPLVLGSMVCALCYLRHSHTKYYVTSCFLAGLACAVKEYFWLIALPVIVVNSIRAYMQRARVITVLFAGTVALSTGLVVQPALNSLDQGTALDSYRSVVEYPKFLIERRLSKVPAGKSSSLTNVLWRLEYVNWLLFSNGATAALTLGGIFLACGKAKSTDRWQLALLTGTIFAFMLFLMFCPARLVPVLFVEMQRRYLTVVIPFWALSLAAVYSSQASSMTRSQQSLLILVLVLYAISGLNQADNRLSWVYGSIVRAEGLRECLKMAKSLGIDTVLVTQYFKWHVPSEWEHGRPAVVMLPGQVEGSVLESIRRSARLGRVGLYIARQNYKELQRKAAREHVSYFEIADAGDEPLLEAVVKSGWQVTPVYVPHRASHQHIGKRYLGSSDRILVGYLFHPKGD